MRTLVGQDRLLEIHDRLCAEFGCPVAFFHALDPISEIVSSLLSHRTKNKDSGAAFRALRERYSSWEAMIDAPTEEIETTIRAVTWPEQKAPRIQSTLRWILAERGDLSLDFLGEMSVGAAREWLERIPGVGPKTSAAVLIFSRLRMRALPVDSHHHRVAQRLGLISTKLDVGPSHAVLGGDASGGVGRAGGLRSPRGHDVPRPAHLHPSRAAVPQMSSAGSLPHGAGEDAGHPSVDLDR